MDEEDNSKKEIEALSQRFEKLLLSDNLSDDQKSSLAREILKVISKREEEV
jgi:hypothetical protein